MQFADKRQAVLATALQAFRCGNLCRQFVFAIVGLQLLELQSRSRSRALRSDRLP
ncbi:hypothetical protein [Rhizobium leguminosarum]|uniref:hypothetical protein n=1 Tax=Rhizobium leguminosarum TaxID=384 RepID=UPI001FEF94CC|nr:hypothetical protein [Rhizobium leguminosarum]